MSFDQCSHENDPVKILHEILKLSFDQCSHENNPVTILHEILKLSFDQCSHTLWHIRHGEQVREWFSSDWRYHTQFWKWTNLRSSWFIHVIELLCYNWRFANFWLEIWSHNWRFFIDVFDVCFYCLLMFSFCLFQYWTNCIPFQYILFTFLS